MIYPRDPVLLGTSVNQFIQGYFFTLTDTEVGGEPTLRGGAIYLVRKIRVHNNSVFTSSISSKSGSPEYNTSQSLIIAVAI